MPKLLNSFIRQLGFILVLVFLHPKLLYIFVFLCCKDCIAAKILVLFLLLTLFKVSIHHMSSLSFVHSKLENRLLQCILNYPIPFYPIPVYLIPVYPIPVYPIPISGVTYFYWSKFAKPLFQL